MEDINRDVAKELLALRVNEFTKCFQQFNGGAQSCVTSKRKYFEEYYLKRYARV
jgi:hypothetical protein